MRLKLWQIILGWLSVVVVVGAINIALFVALVYCVMLVLQSFGLV